MRGDEYYFNMEQEIIEQLATISSAEELHYDDGAFIVEQIVLNPACAL